MKKLFVILAVLLSGANIFAAELPEVDQKLVQSFQTNFPEAKEVAWHESDESYVVSFTDNGIRSRIEYQKDGKLTHITRSYKEESLPIYVLYLVKKKFPGKQIFGVIEKLTVAEPGDHSKIEYHIKLEDEKTWVTARLDSDGDFSIVEKFRKSLQK